jgi:hypothetical protein
MGADPPQINLNEVGLRADGAKFDRGQPAWLLMLGQHMDIAI